MTWLYIPRKSGTSASTPAAEGLTSASTERCETLAASATWRSKRQPLAHWFRLWKQERWMKRLCGLMPEPLTADASVDAWLASLEGAPAPSSPPRTPSARGFLKSDLPQTEEVSSSDSLRSPRRPEPSGFSGRTSEGQGLLFPKHSSGWNRRAGGAHGQAFQQVMLAHPMRDSASSFWPTVTVCGNYNYKGASPTSGDGVATVARRLMRLLSGQASSDIDPSCPQPSLNPLFAAWLMGWTWWLEGWGASTFFASSGTALSQNKPPQPSDSSGDTASEGEAA